MKDFALYTLARLGLFAAAFALVWLAVSPWVQWGTITAIWVAALALLVSAIASLLLLGPLRDRLSASVHQRAQRLQESVEQARRREDVD